MDNKVLGGWAVRSGPAGSGTGGRTFVLLAHLLVGLDEVLLVGQRAGRQQAGHAGGRGARGAGCSGASSTRRPLCPRGRARRLKRPPPPRPRTQDAPRAGRGRGRLGPAEGAASGRLPAGRFRGLRVPHARPFPFSPGSRPRTPRSPGGSSGGPRPGAAATCLFPAGPATCLRDAPLPAPHLASCVQLITFPLQHWRRLSRYKEPLKHYTQEKLSTHTRTGIAHSQKEKMLGDN